MPKTRRPNDTLSKAQEEFIEGAESQSVQHQSLDERVAARREESRRFQIFVLRGSEAQKALLEHAAREEKCSMQRLIEDMVMPVLEERYGDDVPF